MPGFQYSVEVDPASVKSFSCLTSLPIRINVRNQLADELCHQFLKDIQEVIGSSIYSPCLSLSPVGNCVALFVPECLPEFLQPMVNVLNLVWFVDGTNPGAFFSRVRLPVVHAHILKDSIEYAQTRAEKTRILEAITNIFSLFSHPTKRSLGAKPEYMQILTKIFLECLEAGNEEFWLGLLKSLFDDRSVILSDPTDCMTFDKYMSLRWVHSGVSLGQKLMCFAMGIKLTEAEKASVAAITDPLLKATLLTNDYYSYRKEELLHRLRKNPGHAFNAVSVLMVERNLSEEDALDVVRQMILHAEEEHTRCYEELKKMDPPTGDLLRYIEGARLAAAGISLWHAASPRYSNALPPAASGEVPEFERTVDGDDKKDDLTTNDEHRPRHEENGQMAPLSISEKLLDPRRVEPNEEIVSAPFDYVVSFPSKQTRETFIDSLCTWFDVPEPDVEQIITIVATVHNTTLLLDDIEDGSTLRRENPCAHYIFGNAQTINSANYMLFAVFRMVQRLSNRECIEIFLEEGERLAHGQGLELNWRHCKVCPTMDDYVTMVDNKTGSLINFATRLMQAQALTKRDIPEITSLSTLFGRLFQIRDDLKNLTSEEYTAQKGFCEDLDEGKYSFPLIHCLEHSTTNDKNMILGMLYNPPPGGLTIEMKRFIQNHMHKTNSFAFTEDMLAKMKDEIVRLIGVAEEKTGKKNAMLRLLLRGLAR